MSHVGASKDTPTS